MRLASAQWYAFGLAGECSNTGHFTHAKRVLAALGCFRRDAENDTPEAYATLSSPQKKHTGMNILFQAKSIDIA